jgi:phospholipid/cholesterol/gamma-HCH transport system permease protein
LTATPSGNQLELSPGGAWVAANVASLERLTEAVAPELDRSNSLRVNMIGVNELDTLGAWLLEKLSRRAISRGHRAEIVGIADNYSELMEEVRRVNGHNPAPKAPPNPALARPASSDAPP